MDDVQLQALYARFCQDMLDWIQAGMPETNPHYFSTVVGLCTNLRDWAAPEHADALTGYQSISFCDAGLGPIFPFDSDLEEYNQAKRNSTLYTNEYRLQWLRDHAEIL